MEKVTFFHHVLLVACRVLGKRAKGSGPPSFACLNSFDVVIEMQLDL